jgi:hypothetical protein
MWDHSEIVTGRPAEEKQLINASRTAAHRTLSAPESPCSLCNVTDLERERERHWDCTCDLKLNTAVSFRVGNRLLRAFPKPLGRLKQLQLFWYTLYEYIHRYLSNPEIKAATSTEIPERLLILSSSATETMKCSYIKKLSVTSFKINVTWKKSHIL